MKIAITSAVLFLFTLFSTACVTVPDTITAKVAVQQGVLRAIGNDVEKAQRAIEIIEEVRPNVSEELITIGLLHDYVYSEINWQSLSVADAQLLIFVLSYGKTELEKRIGAGVLDPDQRESVSRVLDWSREAAELVILIRG